MANKLIELFIYSKKMETKDGRKFTKYSTKAQFRMKDENGKLTKEYGEHFIDVKFTEDAFENSKVSLKDIKRGVLKVEASSIGCPDVYEVTTNKDGSKVYPVCWIRGGIASFTPVVREHEFHFVLEEDTNEIEENE